MSNQENNSNNSRLTYPQIDLYYNKVMKITEFPKGSLGHEIYDKEINDANGRILSQNEQSKYIDDGLASAKKKKYIVLRLLNKEEFDKIYKDIKEKFDNETFQNTINHLTESKKELESKKKLPKTNDKGESESESNAIKTIKSIPDKFIDQYLIKKLKEMVNNIDEQLDEVYNLSDNDLSNKRKNLNTNGLYKYKNLFNKSEGGKRTRRRRKSKKSRKSRKSKKARKSRR